SPTPAAVFMMVRLVISLMGFLRHGVSPDRNCRTNKLAFRARIELAFALQVDRAGPSHLPVALRDFDEVRRGFSYRRHHSLLQRKRRFGQALGITLDRDRHIKPAEVERLAR